jgi:hypothetical protein
VPGAGGCGRAAPFAVAVTVHPPPARGKGAYQGIRSLSARRMSRNSRIHRSLSSCHSSEPGKGGIGSSPWYVEALAILLLSRHPLLTGRPVPVAVGHLSAVTSPAFVALGLTLEPLANRGRPGR